MCGIYLNLILQMMKSRFRMVVCTQLLSDVLLFGLYSTPWMVAHKAPLSIVQATILGWVAMPSPGDLLNPGIKPASLVSLASPGRFFTH